MGRHRRVASWIVNTLLLTLAGMSFGEVLTSSREARAHDVFRLENGLRVVVVTDPAAIQATVALTVHAGTKDDPAALPGLTHFIEHVVVGSASTSHPSITGCVAPHGGKANGERRYETTQYHFSAPTADLNRVLKCVARVLVEPNFSVEDVAHELDVIDEEYRANWSSDPRQVETESLKLGMAPDHPWARGFTGNRASLGDDGHRLISAIAMAWHSLYAPERMTLAIVSAHPAQRIRTVANRTFARLTNTASNTNPTVPLASPIREKATLVRYRSTDATQRLTFGFAIPHPDGAYASKGHSYVVSLLESRHEGGMVRHLQDRGWIHGLGTRVVPLGGARALATLTLDLTDAGANHVEAIGTAFFSYVDHLRRNGIDRARFDENARIAHLAMEYDGAQTNRDYARNLSYQIGRFPAEDVIRGPYAWDRFVAGAIEEVLDAFAPDRVLATLSAPTFKAADCGRWLMIPCRVETLPRGWMDAWIAPVAVAFSQPPANPFLPRDLTLVAPTAPDEIDMAGGRLRMTRVVDVAGGVPKAAVYLKLTSPRACREASDAAHTAILQALLRAGAPAARAGGQAAGYDVHVSIDPDGIVVRTYGFNDRLADYTAALLGTLVDLRIDSSTFDAFRDDLQATALATRDGHRSRYQALRVEALQSALARFCSPRGYVRALDAVDLVGFREWLAEFRASLTIDALLYGNVPRKVADRLSKFVAGHVLQGVDFVPMDATPFRLDAPIRLPLDFKQYDGGVAIVLPAPDASVASQALYRALVPLVDQVVHNALRADGGYIAGARLDVLAGAPAVVVMATISSVESLDLVSRIRAALTDAERLFRPKLIDQLRTIAARRAAHQPRDLLGRGDQTWRALQHGLHFRERDIIEVTKRLQDEDFERAYRDLIGAISNRSVIAYLAGSSNDFDPWSR